MSTVVVDSTAPKYPATCPQCGSAGASSKTTQKNMTVIYYECGTKGCYKDYRLPVLIKSEICKNKSKA